MCVDARMCIIGFQNKSIININLSIDSIFMDMLQCSDNVAKSNTTYKRDKLKTESWIYIFKNGPILFFQDLQLVLKNVNFTGQI